MLNLNQMDHKQRIRKEENKDGNGVLGKVLLYFFFVTAAIYLQAIKDAQLEVKLY